MGSLLSTASSLREVEYDGTLRGNEQRATFKKGARLKLNLDIIIEVPVLSRLEVAEERQAGNHHKDRGAAFRPWMGRGPRSGP